MREQVSARVTRGAYEPMEPIYGSESRRELSSGREKPAASRGSQLKPATRLRSVLTCSQICSCSLVVFDDESSVSLSKAMLITVCHLLSRQQAQIRFEIAKRAGEILKVIRKQAAIAEFGNRGRVDAQQQPRDETRLRKRSHAHVEPLQVDEHPHDDLMPRRWFEQRSIEGGGVADVLAQQLAAVDLGKERALVERVDDQHVISRRVSRLRPALVAESDREN